MSTHVTIRIPQRGLGIRRVNRIDELGRDFFEDGIRAVICAGPIERGEVRWDVCFWEECRDAEVLACYGGGELRVAGEEREDGGDVAAGGGAAYDEALGGGGV